MNGGEDVTVSRGWGRSITIISKKDLLSATDFRPLALLMDDSQIALLL